MSSVKQAIVAIGVVEIMLLGLWPYLAMTRCTAPDAKRADFYQTLGSAVGEAMGAVLALAFVAISLAYRNDRVARRRTS